MKTTSLMMAGASRFAHFAGLARPKKSPQRAAEDDDDKSAVEDDDDKDASEDDGDDQDEPKGKRSRRAAEDDDDKDASEGDDDNDQDEPKGKRSRRAAEDDDDKDAEDDDEDEMKGKSAAAQARRREQARISHILGHKAAARNPRLAVSLACTTRMTRQEAVTVLMQEPDCDDDDRDDRRSNRHARQDRQSRNTQLGSDAQPPSGKQAVAASWGAAFEKAGIKTR
jgi:hypothetical protein